MNDPVQPWLRAALQLLRLSRRERVLQLTAHERFATRGILDGCGSEGLVVVFEPNAARADRLRNEHGDAIEVVTLDPDGSEEFGRFDAVLACPVWNPGWSAERWGTIIRRALRPGGRFVLDLPAEACCEVIEAAWDAAGGVADTRIHWHGRDAKEMDAGLSAARLRGVESTTTTHFAHFESPLALAECAVAGATSADAEFVESLRVALTEKLQTTQEVEVVFRRTRVSGMR